MDDSKSQSVSQISEDLRSTLFGRVGKLVKSALPFSQPKVTETDAAPAQNPPPPGINLLVKDQPPLEYRLHYLEPTLTPQEKLREIQEFIYLIRSQIDYNLDLPFAKALQSLPDGYLEAKGYFRIQHNTHTHFTRSFMEDSPETWASTDFWLQVPHDREEQLPPDLYRYDLCAVLQKNNLNQIVDATLIFFVNNAGKISRPQVWETKTPAELQLMAKEFLRFIPEREQPPVGTSIRNGNQKLFYIELINQDAKSYRQCYVSQDGYIRIDLKFKIPLTTLA